MGDGYIYGVESSVVGVDIVRTIFRVLILPYSKKGKIIIGYVVKAEYYYELGKDWNLSAKSESKKKRRLCFIV